MSIQKVALLLCSTWLFSSVGVRAVAEDDRWWPVQATPHAVVRMDIGSGPSPRLSLEMLAQSVAGLAAKAVNEGRGEELVWVNTGNADEEDWLVRLLKRQRQVEVRGTFDVWDLVGRYAQQGLIKGYLLYRADHSRGDFNQHPPAMECSVNVATSLAGLLDETQSRRNQETDPKLAQVNSSPGQCRTLTAMGPGMRKPDV